MKTTKTLIAAAFAVSMAFWAVSCGDDSSSGGSGGNGGHSAKSLAQEKADQVKAVLDSIDVAAAMGNDAILAHFGISSAEAADADLLVAAKARVIDGLRIAGLDGECGVSVECLANWVDSIVLDAEKWENSGDGEYDQACRMVIDANGTCEEHAWKFLDAEAMAFGNTACNELYETAGNLGMASAYIKIEAGRCNKKVKCTIQVDQAPDDVGYLHAIYGYTKEACGEAGNSSSSASSSSGKSSASGGSGNYDAVVHQISGTSHCNEYWYDSDNNEQRIWAQQVMELSETHPEYGMSSGACPTEGYPVTCDPIYKPLEGGESMGTFKIVEHVNHEGWCPSEDDEEDGSGDE
ncbi:MAG: hypothetical protein J6T45_07875 [Fibrobacterales bacterium]|nr:hypothetical protein [Fibrobacterales bacterium]